MKKQQYSAKAILALAMAMSLFVSPVLAKDTVEEIEEELVLDGATLQETEHILTLERAIELAKAQSFDMQQLEATQVYLKAQKEYLRNISGFFMVIDYDEERFIDPNSYSYYVPMYQADSLLISTSDSQAILELNLELLLKNTFSTIKEAERNQELLEASLAVQEKLYAENQLKHQAGMLSAYDLEQSRLECETIERQQEQLVLSLQEQHIALNALIGESPEEPYILESQVEFSIYEQPEAEELDAYITALLKDDYSLKQKQQAKEDAQFAKNIINYSTITSIQQKEQALNFKNAANDLKNAESEKESSIQKTLVQLQQVELSYAQAEAALAQAKESYRVAELNYQAGNLTKMTLVQADLAILQAEQELESLAYTHDMQEFLLANPTLL